MDSKGPSQPSLDQVYTAPGNPAETTASESATASRIESANAASPAGARATRHPHDQRDAVPTPSALGAGVRDTSTSSAPGADGPPAGPGPGPGGRESEQDLQDELDGEQMRAAGEGDIMRAQWEKTGQAEEPSLTSDLDRKKEEQRGMREEVKGARSHGVDVDGALGQRGGPAAVEGR